MKKKINNNGFDYADLGLPSGTLWATCNVGASKPSDFGLYFQWGDTEGYANEQVGKDKQFTWDDYKWSINESDSNFSDYATPMAMLNLEDDAAHVHMGEDWHIPSPTQYQELIDNTIKEWATFDDVNGILFTSNKDDSKFIFIPAAGNAFGSSINFSGNYGNVWSSMLSTNGIYLGYNLCFDSKGAILGSYGSRFYGFSVRGVIG